MRDHYADNLQLLDRIRRGDFDARQQLIEANIGLVHYQCNKLMHGSWNESLAAYHEREGFMERGYHGLCAGAKNILNIKHENVGGFLLGYIKGAMLRKDGNGIKWSPQHINVYANSNDELDRRATGRLNPVRIFDDENNLAETWALILFLCNDGTDLQIVKLRRAGKKQTEVADLMDVSTREVRQRISRIREDFYRIRDSACPIQVRETA
ncbi:MAG: hypothetical protein WBL72_16235 [Thermoguttaceae bacterium]